jgi:regulatory protein
MAGRITALRYQKKNQDRVSIYLDDQFAFGLPAVMAASLKRGQYLSDVEIMALQRQGDVETGYHRALEYLSYRPRSRAEVTTYLQKHGMSEGQAETVTGRLQRAGLLDDEAFARYWVENRERFRPRGLRALRYELRSKGISQEIIDQVLASVDASASAHRAASNKARQLSHLDQQSFHRKLVGYLARRGFDYEVAREVATCCWTELTADE